MDKEAKRAQIYPISAERELHIVYRAYSLVVLKAAVPHIKKMLELYERKTRTDSRFDDVESFRTELTREILSLADDVEDAVSPFSATQMIGRVGNIAKTASLNDWFKLLKDTIGVAPVKEFYDDLFSDSLNMWVSNNVSYVQSIPKEFQHDLAEIILWGYNTKQPMVNVYNRIQQRLGVEKSKARAIARDQMGTLNAQMMRYEQESAGVKKYKWKTRRDSRVRNSHRMLEGLVFSWDDPPAMSYETKSKGIVYTGKFCHPGEDYGCRCTAIPIFDSDVAAAKILSQRSTAR